MSSRLIVKNFPKYIKEDRVRQHFEQKGAVTDVKLCFTQTGQFRRFGFIGFKNEADAVAAQKYFNGSFIDTSKLDVQFAKAVGDDNIPRPWSRHTKGSSAYNREHGIEPVKPEAKDEQTTNKTNEKKKVFLKDVLGDEKDAKLQEFLNVMQPRSTTRTWANDEVGDESNKQAKKEKKPAAPVDSEDELYEDLPTAKTSKKKSSAQETKISDLDYFRSNKADEFDVNDEEDMESEQEESDEEKEQLSRGHKATKKNVMNYGMDSDSEAEAEEQVEEPEPEQPTEEKREEILNAAETGRLFVRNLTYGCIAEELEALFLPFGPLAEVHISIDKETKMPKGYGFVQFLLVDDADKAFNALNGTIFQGRLLDISPAKEKPVAVEQPIDDSNLSFKQKRELERKKNAKKDFNWNSLFMNSDTVASAMAAKLGVRKADILNPEADNMAVRLALAETNIITETKSYLEEEGIDIKAFEGKNSKQGRSKSVIVVKNIPYHTVEAELEDLFGRFGLLGRVVLPPTRTLAVVEFLEENEAKAAFSHLAYSRFKSLPLYLEWAPANAFQSAFDQTAYEEKKRLRKMKEEGLEEEEEQKKAVTNEKTAEPEESETKAAISTSLFVKNLNFTTTDAGLKRVFESLNGFRSARVSTKPDKKNPKVRLSMGFGFVEFNSKEAAKDAMKAMQGFVLDNHALQLKISTGTSTQPPSDDSTKKKSKKSKGELADPDALMSSKIIVRNVPFEATKKDLRQLFTPFGQIKALRIPRKMDGQHRGFAFIDFLTKQEAKAAFEAVGATHLYGRHLVLEWAKDEDGSMEAARLKAKRQLMEVEAAGINKRLKALEDDENMMDDDE